MDYKKCSAGLFQLIAILSLLTVLNGTAAAAGEDNVFQGFPEVSAQQLVDAVLSRNPDLPAMRAAEDAARARIEQAKALDDPVMSYSAAPQTAGQRGMDFGQILSVSQRLPWPGKLGLRGDAARLDSNAARERVEATRLSLVAATKVAHADWYFLHAAIRINGINRTLLREFRNIVEVKYSAGTASKQDALRAEVEVALLEHRDIVLERRRREVLVVLNTLLQRPPDAPVPPPSNLPGVTRLPDVVSLREAALEIHPDLRALEARVEASRRRVALAKRDFYPDIRVTASYNSLWNQGEKRFTVGAGINIPLQGKRRSIMDEARADVTRLDLEQRAKVSQILGEVQRAHDRVRESTHVLSLYRDRLRPLAEENLDAARSDYEAGSGDFLDLIDAEKNLMQTQLELERALADYHRHLATLERSVGGLQAFEITRVGLGSIGGRGGS